MKTLLSITAAAMMAGAPLALAQSMTVAPLPTDTTSKVDTATFVKAVPSANEFEIESSQLAQKQATADDVKAFAAQMVKDHTKAGEDFKAALSKGQTTSATAPAGPQLDSKHQALLDQLKEASGDSFQSKYIEMQTQAHKEAVALFSTYANSGDDPAMKEFAKKTLPVLQMHERHVKQLAAAHQ
jgi:putative membrane protein